MCECEDLVFRSESHITSGMPRSFRIPLMICAPKKPERKNTIPHIAPQISNVAESGGAHAHAYSTRIESTGFMLAARTVCQPTVTTATPTAKAAAITKTKGPMSMR